MNVTAELKRQRKEAQDLIDLNYGFLGSALIHMSDMKELLDKELSNIKATKLKKKIKTLVGRIKHYRLRVSQTTNVLKAIKRKQKKVRLYGEENIRICADKIFSYSCRLQLPLPFLSFLVCLLLCIPVPSIHLAKCQAPPYLKLAISSFFHPNAL